MASIDDFARGFVEEPGYLDYARMGPPSRSLLTEVQAEGEVLARARFGSLDALWSEDERMRDAVAALTRFPAEQIAFQTSTGSALMHVLFGLTGGVLLSPDEFPSVTFATVRAAESLHVVTPLWLETDHGRVTPGDIRRQISSTTAAVVVSLVDARTGYVADIEGIRQVIGDRLLIVDAVQGIGVVDAPFELADVVVAGGHTWARAGWGTGFLAASARALDHITPVFSGYTGAGESFDGGVVAAPSSGVDAFSVSVPDPIAQARLATALEAIAAVGVAEIGAAVGERVERILALADEFAIPVVSPRNAAERAGIAVLQPPTERLALLTAALFNHGVTATALDDGIRLSAHVTTNDETFAMLRAALVSYAGTY